MPRPTPIKPEPGQESVWDYPRPPSVDHVQKTVTVTFAGQRIAQASHAIRVLETSHAPTVYLPPGSFEPNVLIPSDRVTFCEFKGAATYAHLKVEDQIAEHAVWWYAQPTPGFESLAGWPTVYPSRVDRIVFGDDVVTPVGGDFYGSWVTPDVVGPFKGGPGTEGW